MATTIDNKTVQMNFDNSNFERNISQSMNSLKQMDGQLQTMEKSKSLETLNKQAKQVDFSHMSKGLDNVKVHFSALQVAGMTVISELTKKVMHFGSNLMKNTFGQIKSGGVKRALNLEQAEFQVTGLAKSVMKTDKQFKKKSDVWKALLKDVDYAVDGTAYGLDEASKVASQLMASNIKIGGEMKTALRGISGMAAMTGRTYSDIGNIFTKVAGNGRLMSQELLQFSASGLNAAATLTEYLNKNKKVRESVIGVGLQSKKGAKDVKTFAKSTKLTEQNIRTLVTAGAIDFKTFSKAMDDAFGDHATKANETYEGSLMNVKAALSRIGEPVATNTFDNLKDIFNVLIPRINGLKKEILPLLDYINSLTSSLGKFVQKGLKSIIVEYKKVDGKKVISGLKNVKDAIKTFIEIFKNTVDTVISSFKKLYNTVIDPLIDVFDTFSNILKQSLFSDISSVLGGSNKVISSLGNVIEWLGNVLSKVFKIIGSVARILTPIIVPAIQIIIGLIQKAGSLILNAFTNISNVLSNNEGFFIKWANNIVSVFNAIKPLFTSLWNLATSIFDAITKSLGVLFNSFKNSKSKGFDAFVNGLKNVVQNIADVINKIAELIRKTKILQVVTTLISSIFKGIGYVLTNITTVIGKLLNGISTFINKIREGIHLGTILQNVMDTVKNGISNIVKILNQNGDVVVRGSVFALLFVKIKQLIWALRDLQGKGLVKYARPIQQIFTNLRTTIFKFNQQIRYKTLKEIAVSILLLSVSLMILSGIPKQKLTTAITAITSLFIELTMSFKSISSVGSFKLGPVVRTLISLAASVLILSSALKKVSSIDEKKLYKSIGAVSILVAEMIGAIKILSTGNKKLSGGVATLISLAFAVKMLSKSVINLAKLSWEDLKKGLISVGLILSGIVAYLTLSSLVNDKIGKSSIKSAISIVLVAKAIKTLSKVIQTIGNLSWEQITKGLTTIGILLVAITGYIATTAVIGDKIGKSSMKSAASILLIASALKMLSKIVKTLGSMSWAEIGKGLATVGTMMLSFIAFTLLLNKVGGMSLKSAAGILLVAMAIKILAGTVSMLSNIAPEKLVAGLMVFISMLMSLAIALNAMKGTIGGSAALVVASTAILILAVSLKLISSIPIVGLAGSLVTLALTLLIFSKAASAMSSSIPALMGVAGAITLLGIGMALLGVGILALALGLKMVIEVIVRLGTGLKDILVALVMAVVESVKAIVIGVSDMVPELVRALTVLLKGALSIIREIVPELGQTIMEVLLSVLQSIAQNIGPIIQAIIDIVIGIFNGLASRIGDLTDAIGNFLGAIGDQIVKVLGKVSIDKVIKLLLAVTFISIIIKVLSTMQTQAAKAIITVALISVSLLMLTGVFALIGMIDNSLTEKLNSITVFLAVMTLVLIGCAIIGNFAAQALVGLGVLIIAIAAITVVMAALGVLADKLEPFIDKGGPLLVKVGSYIGQFIGAFVGGIAAKAAEALPVLGEALGQFGQKIGPFTKAIKEMPLDMIVKIGALVAAVLAITATSFMNKISTFLSFGEDPIDNFISMMIKLGKGLKKFNATIAGVDASGAETAANVLLKLSQTASLIPSSGGWLQKFTGNKDLDGFGAGVVSLAKGLKSFVSNIDTSIDVSKYEPYVDLIKKMAEIANLIPRSGGWLQNLVGNKDLSGFGEAIKPLSEGIKSFAKQAESIKNPEAVNNIINIVKKMVEIQNDLPSSGGLWQAIAGSKDWDQLSEGLTSMVDCFKEISKSLTGKGKSVNLEVIQNAVKLLQDIAKLNTDAIKITDKANNKKETGDSETYVSKIIEPVKKAVNKIKEYQKTLKQEDMDGMTGYFKVLKNFINNLGTEFSDKETQKNLNLVETVGSTIASLLSSVLKIRTLMTNNGKKDKGEQSLSSQLTSFGNAIIDFSTTMGGLDLPGITNAKNAVDTLKSMSDLKISKFENAKTSVDNLKSALLAFKELNKSENKLTTGKKDPKNNELETLKKYVKSVKSALKDFAKGLNTKDVKNKLKEVSSFGKKMSSFAEGLKAVAGAFNEINKTGVTADKGTSVQQAMANASKAGVEKFYKGLKGKESKVRSAFKSLLKTTKTIAGEVFTPGSFKTIGQNLIDGIIQGINSRTEGLRKSLEFQITVGVKATKKKAKSHSPSKVYDKIGQDLMAGEEQGIIKGGKKVQAALDESVTKGINKSTENVKKGATQLQGAINTNITKVNAQIGGHKKGKISFKNALKHYGKYSFLSMKQTRPYLNTYIDEFYGSVTKVNKLVRGKKAIKAAKKIAKTFRKAEISLYKSSNASEYKTLKDRIKNNKDIMKANKKEHSKYIKAGKKIDDNNDRIAKLRDKKQTKKRKKEIHNLQKDNRHQKKIQKKYKDEYEKYNKARSTKKDTQKTLKDNIKSTWQDLANTIKDNARSFMDPLSNAIDYGLNLFDKFEKGQRISAGRMVANYESNVKAINKYNESIIKLKELADKGKISQDMYNNLKSQGISGLSNIEAVLRMDDNQLSRLKYGEATNKRLTFEKMMRDLKDRIDQSKSWRQKIVELTKRGIDKRALEEILNLGIEEAGPYLDALLSANSSQLKQFNKLFGESRKEEQRMKKVGMASYTKSAVKNGVTSKINKKAGEKAAWNYAAGLISGLSNKKTNKKVSKAAVDLASSIITAVNKRLKINSPSIEGENSGMYTVLGLVRGIVSNINLAQNAGEELADAVINPLQSINTAQNAIDDNPTITPILDLDRLEQDMAELNNMFNNEYALGIAASLNRSGSLGNQHTQSGDIINNYNNEFTQNNYSPEPLDRVGIYRDTKGWINREMKGGVAPA